MTTFFPVEGERISVAKVELSFAFPWRCARSVQFGFFPSALAMLKKQAMVHAKRVLIVRLIMGLTCFATFGVPPLINRAAAPLVLFWAMSANTTAQEPDPPPPLEKRGWMSRLLHPQKSERLP